MLDQLKIDKGPCRRPLDGRARRPAFRPDTTSGAGALAVGRRRGLRFRRRASATSSAPRATTIAARLEARRDGQIRRSLCLWTDAGAVCSCKIRGGFAEFKQMLAEHSAEGAIGTQLGVQRERPSR